MATNQGNIIAAIETLVSKTGLNYSEAILELAANQSITNTNVTGALTEYLQSNLSSSKTNINELLAEYSATHFDGNINSINDLTLGIGSSNNWNSISTNWESLSSNWESLT